jgi:mono/diheme cytochrome c family protein
LYDVSARSSHNSFVSWYLSTTAQAAIKRRAVDIAVPDLDNETLVLAGINDYEAMCVGCHGAPGKSPGPIGLGLNPPAPDLQKSAAKMSTAELFWVTKHGIKMTGMPAWGATHDDNAIWPVVAFTSRLPSLDELGYQSLSDAAVGHGHHSDVPSTARHGTAESAEPSADNVHLHDDGSSDIHEAPKEVVTTQEHDHSTHEH